MKKQTKNSVSIITATKKKVITCEAKKYHYEVPATYFITLSELIKKSKSEKIKSFFKKVESKSKFISQWGKIHQELI